MNLYRRGLQNGVLVNPKLFILEKVNFGPHIKCWSNMVKLGQRVLTRIIWCGSLQKPFFTTLRGANQAEWNEECDREFVAIKRYLTEPPILVSLEAGDTLYLYLAASDIAVSAALFKECGDAKLRPVFFVSKSLTDAETRYSHLERAVLAPFRQPPKSSAHTSMLIPLWC